MVNAITPNSIENLVWTGREEGYVTRRIIDTAE